MGYVDNKINRTLYIFHKALEKFVTPDADGVSELDRVIKSTESNDPRFKITRREAKRLKQFKAFIEKNSPKIVWDMSYIPILAELGEQALKDLLTMMVTTDKKIVDVTTGEEIESN